MNESTIGGRRAGKTFKMAPEVAHRIKTGQPVFGLHGEIVGVPGFDDGRQLMDRYRAGVENSLLLGATVTNNFANQPPLTLERMQEMVAGLPKPRPPTPEFNVVPADRQCRTACDVPLAWVRPRVPSKRAGRRGTRRAWKRRHPPHQTYTWREPTDVIVLSGRARMVFPDRGPPPPDLWLVTPSQMDAINRAIAEHNERKV